MQAALSAHIPSLAAHILSPAFLSLGPSNRPILYLYLFRPELLLVDPEIYVD